MYYEAVGRRKEATCRVRLAIASHGTFEKGKLYVNGKSIQEAFAGPLLQKRYEIPFQLTGTLDRFAVTAHISGGGIGGQIEAFVLASARALTKADVALREPLKKQGLLRVDARVKERRKAGLAQKARKEKQSPKR